MRGWTGCERSCLGGGRLPCESMLSPRMKGGSNCGEASATQALGHLDRNSLGRGSSTRRKKPQGRTETRSAQIQQEQAYVQKQKQNRKRPSPQTQEKTAEKHHIETISHARAPTGTPADSLWIINRRSRTSSTTLSGVDAPDVTPIVTGPAGRKPSTTCSSPSEER